MSESVLVRAEKKHCRGEAADLVLTSLDGTGRVWKRHYDAKLALAFDAHEMGVLHALKPTGTDSDKEVRLDTKTLERFRFTLQQAGPGAGATRIML